MKKVEIWLIKALLKARVGKLIAKLFEKAEGWKTYIALVLLIVIKFLVYSEIIPAAWVDLANEICVALYGVITVSFGDKIKRYWEAIKKTGDEVIK